MRMLINGSYLTGLGWLCTNDPYPFPTLPRAPAPKSMLMGALGLPPPRTSPLAPFYTQET